MDITKGEIYMATCLNTNKSYIGQCKKFITSNKQSWGHEKRWKRHCYEAANIEKCKSRNNLIHQAINEFGKESFQLKKLIDCDLNELDVMEKHYITFYNTIEPNGYNMTSGGKKTTHSKLSNIKKSEGKKNASIDNIVKVIKENTISTRKTKTKRKEENMGLPKYVTKYIRENKHVGYRVRFNNGISKKTIIEKNFQDSKNINLCLQEAIKYVDELQKNFDKKLEEYKNNLKTVEEVSQITNIPEQLPEHVYPILINNIVNGYFVFGLRTWDDKVIPRRDFTLYQNTHNLYNCQKFIELVNLYNNKKQTPPDWKTIPIPRKDKDTNLPTHVRPTYYKGEISGYRVDYFIRYDENKKQIVETKTFTSKKLSLEEKLNLAKKHVAELKEKYSK